MATKKKTPKRKRARGSDFDWKTAPRGPFDLDDNDGFQSAVLAMVAAAKRAGADDPAEAVYLLTATAKALSGFIADELGVPSVFDIAVKEIDEPGSGIPNVAPNVTLN